MYAIIRAGGKQSKVSEGDVLSVELIKDTDKVTYTPLLIVSDDGSVIADPAKLKKATVTAEILGQSAGPKIDIFKYKNKTGYRRRMGHRQKYTTIKVTGIEAPTTKKKAAKPAKADKPAKAAKADKPAKAAKADKPAKAAKADKPAKAAKADKASKPSDDAGTEEA
jgi:large subunit ribosomal protein L21